MFTNFDMTFVPTGNDLKAATKAYQDAMHPLVDYEPTCGQEDFLQFLTIPETTCFQANQDSFDIENDFQIDVNDFVQSATHHYDGEEVVEFTRERHASETSIQSCYSLEARMDRRNSTPDSVCDVSDQLHHIAKETELLDIPCYEDSTPLVGEEDDAYNELLEKVGLARNGIPSVTQTHCAISSPATFPASQWNNQFATFPQFTLSKHQKPSLPQELMTRDVSFTQLVANTPPPSITKSSLSLPSVMPTTRVAMHTQPISCCDQGSSPSIGIRCFGEIQDVWYAERPFPAFTLELYDTATGFTLSQAMSARVQVSVLDGFGNNADDKLTTSDVDRVFQATSGLVTIKGLRFCGVSSKNGGHFQLVATVLDRQNASPFFSSPIQILSYRLYHAPKVPCDQLRPEDSVSKMKGIGNQYAKRLQSIGIERVSQLARLDLNALGEEGCKRLLDSLRKERGALTRTKLEGHIASARAIVDKFENATAEVAHSSPTHTHARRKDRENDMSAPSAKRTCLGSSRPMPTELFHFSN